jgi:hypothetical protein
MEEEYKFRRCKNDITRVPCHFRFPEIVVKKRKNCNGLCGVHTPLYAQHRVGDYPMSNIKAYPWAPKFSGVMTTFRPAAGVEILVEGEESTRIVGVVAEEARRYLGLKCRELDCVFGWVIKSISNGERSRTAFLQGPRHSLLLRL